MSRPKAYFVNGGAGRVISSVPAFEKLAETDKDFIIVCEGGSEIFRGHPVLHKKAYDHWHKGLFYGHLVNRDLVSPEPYRVWEYYNQKCSLSQAFDILINDQGIRPLPNPSLYLSKQEIAQANNIVQEVKYRTGFDKVVVVQPFGRTIQPSGGNMFVDPTSRSFVAQDIIDIINDLRKDYAVIVMSEFALPCDNPSTGSLPLVAQPQIPDIRIWAAIIELADHFLGCDSLGQHLACALDKTATVVTGATFPINVSYPDNKNFDIIDAGAGRRTYSPIRISQEDEIDRSNDRCMDLTEDQIKEITKSVRKRLGKSESYKGSFVPQNFVPPSTEGMMINTGDSERAARATFTSNPISSAITQGLTGTGEKANVKVFGSV